MLQIDREDNQRLNLLISDQLGRVLLAQELRAEQETVDLKQLPSGIYFLSLNDGQKQITKKIIKQ